MTVATGPATGFIDRRIWAPAWLAIGRGVSGWKRIVTAAFPHQQWPRGPPMAEPGHVVWEALDFRGFATVTVRREFGTCPRRSVRSPMRARRLQGTMVLLGRR